MSHGTKAHRVLRCGIASATVAALAALLLLLRAPVHSQRTGTGGIGQVTQLASNVYFHEGDLRGKGHCNNGWVIFDDYVLVIDANFPSGALEIIPKIRALTNKPIRFAFDTHHHGDHAYGNQVWVEHGATPVAHAGVIDEMKKYETGYYGDRPGRWEEAARTREDVRNSRLKPPTLLFPKELYFDDGKQRVELRWFGVAHTHGDGWAWLPKERILFTGDACVNGPYNYTGDGNIGQWIRTLAEVQKLRPRIVAPGHGPVGGPEVLEEQKQYFIALRRGVQRLVDARKSAAEVQAAIPALRAEIERRREIARYVGDFFPAQVAKVYQELTGQTLPPSPALALAEATHAHWHGHDHGHGHTHP